MFSATLPACRAPKKTPRPRFPRTPRTTRSRLKSHFQLATNESQRPGIRGGASASQPGRMRECCHLRLGGVSQGFPRPSAAPRTARHSSLLACSSSAPAYACECPPTSIITCTDICIIQGTGKGTQGAHASSQQAGGFGTAAGREQTATALRGLLPLPPNHPPTRPDITQGSASQGPRHSCPLRPPRQDAPHAHNVKQAPNPRKTRRCPSQPAAYMYFYGYDTAVRKPTPTLHGSKHLNTNVTETEQKRTGGNLFSEGV